MAEAGSVGIIRDARSGLDHIARIGERMYIYTESGRVSISLYFAPREIEYGGYAQEWVQTERSGRTPLLLRKADQLKTLRFSFLLTDPKQPEHEMTGEFLALEALGKTSERVLVSYSNLEVGLWRVTEVSLNSELRHPDPRNNLPTRATASVTLTQASDPSVAIGPVSGGAGTGGGGGGAPAPPRTHRVVKGDTLWGISLKYYGKGTLWPRIFDANRDKIRDPHWIYPLQVFNIP